MTVFINKKKYPKDRESIDPMDYEALVHEVLNKLTFKFGKWILEHKEDLINSGFCGIMKAKNKYIPGRGSFLALAYLRVQSAMQLDIAKHAKYLVNTTSMYHSSHSTEDCEDSLSKLSEIQNSPSSVVDYETAIKLIRDPGDRKVAYGLMMSYPYFKLRGLMNESDDDHAKRVARIREEICNIAEILYPNN